MSEKHLQDIDLQTATVVAERVQERGDESYSDISVHTHLHENKAPYEVIEEDGSAAFRWFCAAHHCARV